MSIDLLAWLKMDAETRFSEIIKPKFRQYCDIEGEGVVKICGLYRNSLQNRINDLLRDHYKRQAAIYYGFYQSLDINASAHERQGDPTAYIAISTGSPLNLLAHFSLVWSDPRNFPDYGNPAMELRDAPKSHRQPRDPVRSAAAVHMTNMLVSFITYHEMAHILNGHLRLQDTGKTTKQSLEEIPISIKRPLRMQTLEMDADASATTDAIQFVLMAEVDRNLKVDDYHADTETALRHWLFAVATFFLLMQDGSRSAPINKSSHPPPDVRFYIVMKTLEAYFKQGRYPRFEDKLEYYIREAMSKAQTAFASLSFDLFRKPALGYSLMNFGEVEDYTIELLEEWTRLRPLLEPLSTGGNLAPAQFGLRPPKRRVLVQ